MIQTRTNQAKWDAARKRWRIDVQRNGVRRSFYSSQPGRNGKAECHRKADVWINEGTIGGDTRCGVLLDRYLEDIKGRVGRARLHAVTSYLEVHIRPHIGNIRVRNLTRQHMQAILDDMAHFARSTISGVRAAMSSFLTFCRKNDFTKLTLEDVTSPKGTVTPKRRSLQPDDLRKLYTSAETMRHNRVAPDWYIHAYRFLVATGLRPAELIALTHDAQVGRVIKIRASINSFGERTEGKTDAAKRDVGLSDLAVSILNDQAVMLSAANVTSQYIFCNRDGSVMNESRLRANWIRYCEHNNIQRVSLYELRHTYISLNKAMPKALLKLQVGHTPGMDTYGVYSHQVEGDLERAAAYTDEVFSAILDRTFDRT